MTNTNPRDLIHGLAQSVEILLDMRSADAKPMRITEKRLEEARAYLAQPEPEEPTDEEIMRLACSLLGYEYTTSLLSAPVQCIGALDALPSELVAFARAVRK